MSQAALESLTHAQKERLAFIDFSLQYFGQVARADLIQRFKTGLAACTRDLTAYRELAPQNLQLLHQTKNYHRTEEFKPLFEHSPEAILTGLCRGFGDGVSNGIQPSENCVEAIRLVHPGTEVIAALMRAINGEYAISCQYTSLSSGTGKRELVPHAIANNGHRWHVRAFDRKHNEFRDFVCTRLNTIRELKKEVELEETREYDHSWNHLLKLELMPHPSLKHPQAIELDYQMTKGKLELEVRVALMGYLLRQWNVDCTEDASLQGNEYQLWLSNISQVKNELQGFPELVLAPGFQQQN